MKTLLLSLFLAAPLLAGEAPQPSESGGISPGDVGLIIASLLSVGGGSFLYGKSRAMHVEGEIKERKEYATREEMENLRRDIYADMNRLATEIGSIKTYTSEIKGELEHIAATQQQILNRLINK